MHLPMFALVISFGLILSVRGISVLTTTEGQNGKGGQVVVGIYGGSVTLECDLPKANPPMIAWKDNVWNTKRSKELIYNSSVALEVVESHMRHMDMEIDNEHRLTINNLLSGEEEDNEYEQSSSGDYFCYSLVGGQWKELKFFISLAGKPECDGEDNLREGEHSTLTCTVPFTGNMPVLKFSRNGENVGSKDENSVFEAKTMVDVSDATYMDDQAQYICKMVVGELVEECAIKINVGYKVRDLKLKPDKEILHVGEEIQCSAMGNPKPVITMESSRGMKSKSGSMEVKKNWLHQLTTIKCSAENSLDGNVELIETEIIFNVTELAKPVSGGSPKSVPAAACLFVLISALVSTVVASLSL